jgi:hypothetical protein
MNIINCNGIKSVSKDLQGYYVVTSKLPLQCIIARFKTLQQAEQYVQNNQ